MYKMHPQPLHFICTKVLLSALVSLLLPPLFSSQRPSWIARLTPISSLYAGPRTPPELRAAPRATGPPPSPPDSRRAVAGPVSFRLNVIPLPRSVPRANTLSHYGPWTHPARTFLLTIKLSAASARATHRVDIDVVHPHHALQTASGQATPYTMGPHP
jgi:hypothetical protein